MATGSDRMLDAETRARFRRRILTAQGAYYVLTGLWPLVHFASFAQVVGIQINAFQAHAFSGVIVVVGAALLEAVRRGAPGAYPTLLGASVAGVLVLVEGVWLPQFETFSALWLDLAVELVLVVALAVMYPREADRPGTSSTRRR